MGNRVAARLRDKQCCVSAPPCTEQIEHCTVDGSDALGEMTLISAKSCMSGSQLDEVVFENTGGGDELDINDCLISGSLLQRISQILPGETESPGPVFVQNQFNTFMAEATGPLGIRVQVIDLHGDLAHHHLGCHKTRQRAHKPSACAYRIDLQQEVLLLYLIHKLVNRVQQKAPLPEALIAVPLEKLRHVGWTSEIKAVEHGAQMPWVAGKEDHYVAMSFESDIVDTHASGMANEIKHLTWLEYDNVAALRSVIGLNVLRLFYHENVPQEEKNLASVNPNAENEGEPSSTALQQDMTNIAQPPAREM